MGELRRIGSLEIDQDLAAQRWEWRVSQVAWVVFVVVLLAGLLGLLGPGPLSSATAGERGSGLWIEYSRFGHARAPGRLRVHTVTEGEEPVLALWVDRAYLGHLELAEILPQPEREQCFPDRLVYEFRPGGPAGEVTVELCFKYDAFGLLRGALGREGESGVTFRQFIFP
jgi:hypothetical protein